MRFLSILLLVLGGCASSLPPAQWYEGDRLDTTIVTLSKQEELKPLDAAIKRDLGIALAQAGYTERALEKLRTAKELSPKDPLTLYFYARSADQMNSYEEALVNYSEYMTETRRRDGVILARIKEISKVKARKELSRALRQESYIDAGSLDPAIVAVPQYANLTRDKDLAPLSRGLALILITDLSRVAELRVVERHKLNVLQDEMELSKAPIAPVTDEWAPIGTTVGLKERLSWLTSPRGFPYYSGPFTDSNNEDFQGALMAFQEDHDLAADGVPGPRTRRVIEAALKAMEAALPPAEVDSDSVNRMGALLGAGTIVLGSFTPISRENIQLQAAIAHLTGELLPTPLFQGRISNVLRLQKTLTLEILEALGVEVSEEVRRLMEPLPTENFPAFLAYCRGLDFEARGLPAEAIEAYRQATLLDPDFSLAQEASEVAGILPEQTLEYSSLLLNNTLSPQGDVLGQIYRISGWIGMGPGVVLNRDDDDDTEESSAKKIEPARILVEGELPDREEQP